jgi:DHA2 family multidrug resistance protein
MGGYITYAAVVADPRIRVATPILGSPQWKLPWAESPHGHVHRFFPTALLSQTAGVDGVIIAYTLASGVTIPLTGFIAERFGNKRTYLVALGLFVAGSACCALAPSFTLLVGFRVLQGIGGGMLAPLGIAILFDAFPEQERGLANGIFGIPLVVAPASGPLLGGYFTEYLNWRYIFLVNLPIGLLGIILGSIWLRTSHSSTLVKLDLPGLILSMIGFSSLLYALQRGASIGWTSPLLLIILSIGVVAFGLFVIVEWKTPAPLLDLHLFLHRAYACASVVGWIGYIALFGAEFLRPL